MPHGISKHLDVITMVIPHAIIRKMGTPAIITQNINELYDLAGVYDYEFVVLLVLFDCDKVLF